MFWYFWGLCFGAFGMTRVQLKSVFMEEGSRNSELFHEKKKIEKSYHLLTLKDLVALVITTGCPRLQISWNRSTAAEVSVLPSRRKTQPLSSQEWGTVQY